jgi:4-hydroxy 2-oxovalerate aldolase
MKLLDCTLRDGGYYTNWDFPKELVDTYIKSFNDLPIEYLEVGYRSRPQKEYLGEYFYCPIPVLKKLKQQGKKKLVIILNEKDVRAEHADELLAPILPYVSMVRLAVDPQNFQRALILGKAVKRLGFELCFNVMYMSNWSKHPELMANLNQLEGMADYLYMVDSFGGVYPQDVIDTIQLIREKTNIPLGFHGHNNLELGLINTLAALEHGVEIVDATITGMGRGAGNLKMELLLTVLNAKEKLKLDFNALSKVVDGFTNLQKQYEWGTNLPYMVSGAHSLPQKEVMEWVSKRYYSFNSIIRALDNQSKGVKDNQTLDCFESQTKCDKVLIIGGGPSVELHKEAINQWLSQNTAIPIIHASSKNAMLFHELENTQYFCLVGNEGHRMENIFGDVTLAKGQCILPPFPRKMGTYVPKAIEHNTKELKEINFINELQEAHTTIALQTAIELGTKEIFVVGYDGYSGVMMGDKEQELYKENELIFIRAKSHGLSMVSLTPSAYTELKVDSIYARL